jgi:hypothetical protein
MNRAVEITFKILRRPCEPAEHLLRDCLALSAPVERRPARLRLEDALGPELTQRLVTTLTVGSRG